MPKIKYESILLFCSFILFFFAWKITNKKSMVKVIFAKQNPFLRVYQITVPSGKGDLEI